MYTKIFMPLNASPYLSIIRCVKGSDVKANSVDTDQTSTAPVRSSLIWVYTVCRSSLIWILLCLLGPICMNIWGKYGNNKI